MRIKPPDTSPLHATQQVVASLRMLLFPCQPRIRITIRGGPGAFAERQWRWRCFQSHPCWAGGGRPLCFAGSIHWCLKPIVEEAHCRRLPRRSWLASWLHRGLKATGEKACCRKARGPRRRWQPRRSWHALFRQSIITSTSNACSRWRARSVRCVSWRDRHDLRRDQWQFR